VSGLLPFPPQDARTRPLSWPPQVHFMYYITYYLVYYITIICLEYIIQYIIIFYYHELALSRGRPQVHYMYYIMLMMMMMMYASIRTRA
jgi:hypothetical protein